MAVDPDDDALSWAGDDDATPLPLRQSKKRAAAVPPSVADPIVAEDAPADAAASSTDEPVTALVAQPESVQDQNAPFEHVEASDGEERDTQQLGSVALLSVGVLAGIYLLYTIGWVIGSGRVVSFDSLNSVEAFMAGLGRVFAIAAPALWAAAVLWLGRNKAVGWRLAWAAVGVVLLVPWPFVMQS
ncbi:MAG: hypothetical protein ACTJHU_06465 [Mycetocola sp.]